MTVRNMDGFKFKGMANMPSASAKQKPAPTRDMRHLSI